MSRRAIPGFWRERARGVGYLVLLGVAVLLVATLIATLALVAVR
jgi:hypothetical protein